MKIKLEYPFCEKWGKGYLVTNSENRRNVILYNSHRDRTTVSYARYLMSIHLGRFLTNDEHVDHIDNNKTNDVIENLQILSQIENSRKQSAFAFGGKKMVQLKCPFCKSIFERKYGNTQLVPCNKYKISCCSKTCSNCFNSYRNKFDDELLKFISEEQVLTVFRK